VQEQILEFITDEHITVIIVDTRDPHMGAITSVFYNLLFLHPNLTILSALDMYEDIFRRIPLSMLEHTWFIEHITRQPRPLYDAYHRTIDICFALLGGLATLLVLPFVAVWIRREDGGPIFYVQRRIGKDNQPLSLIKFRTMTALPKSEVDGPARNTVTRAGAFLRKTRIDELPQLWNVLRGGYSLIGPRPEIPAYVQEYARAIPYYNARHLITPGLSGWAQLHHQAHPHHGVNVEETRNKLSYDLYYLKNRSFWLDIEIALKTFKTLVMLLGR
jgi:Sugar transferases involved in lipopolysaccharide synthesis